MTDSLALLLGTVVTTLGGIFVLWLNQRNEFRKAAQQRKEEREASAARSAVITEKLATSTAVLSEKVSSTTAALLEKVDSNKTAITDTVSAISDKVDDTTERITGKVEGTANDWADRVAATAKALAEKNDAETARKHELLADIQVAVNGRLTAAIAEVAELKKVVQELVAMIKPGHDMAHGKIVKRKTPTRRAADKRTKKGD